MKIVNRNSNIELLRIVCMLMIISGHIVMEYSLLDLASDDEVIGLFWRGACSVAVNAFVLITGYFGIKYRWERLIKLDVQVLFYSISLFALALILGWHQIIIKEDFLYLFPLLSKKYWFVTCYAVLYIISPLLNKWCDSMSKFEFRTLLIGGFIIIYVWPTLSFLFNSPQFIADAGYGIVNFTYLYMLGYYLRHYFIRKSALVCWGGYIFSVTALFICQYVLSLILGFEFTSFISYNTIFVFIGAICLFLAFERMAFSSNIINAFAKPCLAVYLIHLHPCIWAPFCNLIKIQNYHGLNYILLLVILPIIIYLPCAFFEIIRLKLFGKIESLSIDKIRRLVPQTNK